MTALPQSFAIGDYLDLTLDRLGDGITVQDASGALVYANESGARLTGFDSAEELLRTPVDEVVSRFELFDETSSPMSVADLPGRRALRGEYPPEMLIQVRSRTSDVVRWSVVQALPVLGESGEVIYAINLFRDVTERVEADRRLRFLVEDRERLLASEQDARAQAEEVAESLRKLERITQAALAHVAGADLLGELLREISIVLEADTSAILLLDEERGFLTCARPTASTASSPRPGRFPSARGWPAGWPPVRSRSSSMIWARSSSRARICGAEGSPRSSPYPSASRDG